MDNIQKAGVVVIPALVVVVIAIFSGISWNAMSERDRCSELSSELDHRSADIDARKASLGGQLDLNGQMSSDIAQYNMDVRDYNEKCTT